MVVEPQDDKQPQDRDLAAVETTDWPTREFPPVEGRLGEAVPIVIKQSILQAVYRHGEQHPDVEVCGVLVGRAYRDDEGPFVYIEGAIRGDHAGSQAAQVTFTGETWSHIYEVLDSEWPDERILGWYHTHPGLGIFLSEMDLFIQENFFGAAEQVAFVYDPQSNDEGLFVWQSGKPQKSPFLVEKDVEEAQVGSSAAEKPQATATGPEMSASGGDQRLPQQIEWLARRQNIITGALVALWFVAIAWPIGLFLVLREDNSAKDAPPPPVEQPPNVFKIPTVTPSVTTPSLPAEKLDDAEKATADPSEDSEFVPEETIPQDLVPPDSVLPDPEPDTLEEPADPVESNENK